MDVREAMSAWSEADMEMGFEHRGYPACIDERGGVVAIADHSDNGSNLTMYDAGEFVAWIESCVKAVDNGEFDAMYQAINEIDKPLY